MYFLVVLGRKSNIKALVGLVSSEASRLGLQMVALLLALHRVVPLWCMHHSVSQCVHISSFYKETGQIGLGPTLAPHFNLVTFL